MQGLFLIQIHVFQFLPFKAIFYTFEVLGGYKYYHLIGGI